MRTFFHKLAALITGKPRQVIQLEWADSPSFSYNTFRAYEYIFGRREGIRFEMSSNSFGVVQFHTWESAIVWMESKIRQFKLPVFSIKKVYLPQLSFIGVQDALPNKTAPYVFAIALDTSAVGTETNNTGQSWTHVCTGTNRMLIVGNVAEGQNTDPYSNMTYNSVAMTAIPGQASTGRYIKMWSQGNPSSGSAFTIQPTLTSQFNQGASISYSGCAATTDGDNRASGTSAVSVSVTVTPNTAGNNDWVTWFAQAVGGNFSVSTGIVRQTGGAPMAMGDSNATVSSAGYTQTVTFTSSAQFAIIGVAITPFTTVTVNANFLTFF